MSVPMLDPGRQVHCHPIHTLRRRLFGLLAAVVPVAVEAVVEREYQGSRAAKLLVLETDSVEIDTRRLGHREQ